MSKVKRVYVEKKQPYAVKAKELTEDIKGYLGINTLDAVRVLVRYDVENLSEDTYKKALTTVFSEPPDTPVPAFPEYLPPWNSRFWFSFRLACPFFQKESHQAVLAN